MGRQIEQEDLTTSIADALQFISQHPPDFVHALRRAYAAETHAPARAAIEQLLINSRLAALGRRPICQDTGVVQVFLRIGVGVQFGRRDARHPVACSRWSTKRSAPRDPRQQHVWISSSSGLSGRLGCWQ